MSSDSHVLHRMRGKGSESIRYVKSGLKPVDCLQDNDAYKASCRPYLNTWISSIPPMQHSQKIIVLVNTPTPLGHKSSESKGGVFGNIRGTSTGNASSAILSKMKADFEVRSKERSAEPPSRTRYDCVSFVYCSYGPFLVDALPLHCHRRQCRLNPQRSCPIQLFS